MSRYQLQRNWRAIAAVALLASVLVSFAQETNSLPPAPRRPSVILIVADGVGCADLGCYGSTRVKTPNLDKLAVEGARFTSFYAGSPADSASRAALMLGLHTGHLNIRDDSSGAALRARDLAFSQLLQQSGYRTGLLGTWGLSDGASGLPRNKGFDQFAGFLNTAESEKEYPEFIHRYEPATVVDKTFDGRTQLSGNAQGGREEHIFDLLAKSAMNFVRINKPEQFNHYRPFFLLLAYPLPQEVGQSQADHEALVARMDTGIGQLLEKLKHLRIETDAIVIFTSSRASQKSDQSANMLAEGRIRVPFIARWPARLKPCTISEPWAAWDVFPAMTDIAREDCPTNIDGVSFYQTLRGQAQTNRHDFLYWEFHDAKRGSQQAARTGNWKAVRKQAGQPLELYDLQSDPDEKSNLAGKHPDVIANFEKYLKTARNGADRWPMNKPADEASKLNHKP